LVLLRSISLKLAVFLAAIVMQIFTDAVNHIAPRIPDVSERLAVEWIKRNRRQEDGTSSASEAGGLPACAIRHRSITKATIAVRKPSPTFGIAKSDF